MTEKFNLEKKDGGTLTSSKEGVFALESSGKQAPLVFAATFIGGTDTNSGGRGEGNRGLKLDQLQNKTERGGLKFILGYETGVGTVLQIQNPDGKDKDLHTSFRVVQKIEGKFGEEQKLTLGKHHSNMFDATVAARQLADDGDD